MEYLLMTYETPENFADREGPAAEAYMAEWMSYVDAIHQSGIIVASGGLQPPDTATTVTIRGGERSVQDGPYADSKEQLGGFFVIDVPDLDTALEWAARSPSASHSGAEVRPLIPRVG
jgi:hypothetical protein